MDHAKHVFYKVGNKFYVASYLKCYQSFDSFEDAVKWVEENHGIKFISAAYMVLEIKV